MFKQSAISKTTPRNPIGELTENVALETCREAAKEEVRLAVENGDVNKDGVPMITVVAETRFPDENNIDVSIT